MMTTEQIIFSVLNNAYSRLTVTLMRDASDMQDALACQWSRSGCITGEHSIFWWYYHPPEHNNADYSPYL